jgi:hypothetical protein
MKQTAHCSPYATLSKERARIRAGHLAAASIINSQDRTFHISPLLTKISEENNLSVIFDIRI